MNHLVLPLFAATLFLLPAHADVLPPTAYEVIEQDKVTDAASTTSWLTELHLFKPDILLSLMVEQAPDAPCPTMDKASIRVEWLNDSLLWVSWQRPCPEKPELTRDFHVVSILSEGRLYPCLHQSFPVTSTAKLPVAVFSAVDAADKESQRMQRTLTYSEQAGGLTVQFTQHTTYHVIDNKVAAYRDIQETDADISARFEGQAGTLDELATLVAGCKKSYGAQHILAGLRSLNPSLKDQPRVPDTVKLPYEFFYREGPYPDIDQFFGIRLSSPVQWLDEAGGDVGFPVQFSGRIGDDIAMQMVLTFSGTDVKGTMWYDKYKKEITLKGERHADKLSLEESDAQGMVTGRYAATFDSPVSLRGAWASPDSAKTLPFVASVWSAPEDPKKPSYLLPPPREMEFELKRTPIESADPDSLAVQFALVLAGSQKPIPLGPYSEKKKKEGYEEPLGFDEKSLAIRRVTDTLVEITWATLPQGNGINTNFCTLLLEKDGSEWRTVFADGIQCARYHAGGGEGMGTRLHFDSRPGQGLFLTKDGDQSQSSPEYGGIYTFQRSEWPCELKSGTLTIHTGKAFLNIGSSGALSIWELTHFRGGSVQTLRTLNPSLRHSNACSGVILMNGTLQPYQADPQGPGYYGGSD